MYCLDLSEHYRAWKKKLDYKLPKSNLEILNFMKHETYFI